MKKDLTASQLRELVVYDSATGLFSSRDGVKVSCSRHNLGFVLVSFAGFNFLAHRLAWLYVHGSWPSRALVHKNRDITDNRLCNLKLFPRVEKGELTAERLRAALDYNPETGEFIWRNPEGHNKRFKGHKCSFIDAWGYGAIHIAGKLYKSHRLAWLYVHGVWPKRFLDHINGNRADNRICNLREASDKQNAWNTRRPTTNISGIKGVSWDEKNEQWRASIGVNGKSINLGRYDCKEDAARAYRKAATQHFGEYANFDRADNHTRTGE